MLPNILRCTVFYPLRLSFYGYHCCLCFVRRHDSCDRHLAQIDFPGVKGKQKIPRPNVCDDARAGEIDLGEIWCDATGACIYIHMQASNVNCRIFRCHSLELSSRRHNRRCQIPIYGNICDWYTSTGILCMALFSLRQGCSLNKLYSNYIRVVFWRLTRRSRFQIFDSNSQLCNALKNMCFEIGRHGLLTWASIITLVCSFLSSSVLPPSAVEQLFSFFFSTAFWIIFYSSAIDFCF